VISFTQRVPAVLCGWGFFMPQGMIPKSVKRFSEQIMPKQENMIPKSVKRFSEKIMPKQEKERRV
jgi:hypothetical protein